MRGKDKKPAEASNPQQLDQPSLEPEKDEERVLSGVSVRVRVRVRGRRGERGRAAERQLQSVFFLAEARSQQRSACPPVQLSGHAGPSALFYRFLYLSLREMWPLALISVCFLALHCAADQCNWTGSGFVAGLDSRIVLQVRLRCTGGFVRWLYPGPALRVVIEPNVSSSLRSTVCIKPSPSFGGASVFVERNGELELLGAEGHRLDRQVLCFRADAQHRPAIYLQASPQGHGPRSRNTIGFKYELLTNTSVLQRDKAEDTADHRVAGGHRARRPTFKLQILFRFRKYLVIVRPASCRPCNDTELLLAICNSDFVVRGYIRGVSHDSKKQTTLIEVSATKVYWQRSGLFEPRADPSLPSRPSVSWLGHIHTLLRCHVKPGDGEFLFTGSEHFGDAWLGCAPRYKDFLFVYYKARMEHRNSCDFPVD
ncbi:unnamed protein product [Menidia menidia]|uniref:(Atlantic silverside) hypothetical protein n=1 Tax=Menidia menidia TaxID=238744 RepID=A0A8S4AV48_9TELE|nr:unnamed protein product [Menidia menidia]